LPEKKGKNPDNVIGKCCFIGEENKRPYAGKLPQAAGDMPKAATPNIEKKRILALHKKKKGNARNGRPWLREGVETRRTEEPRVKESIRC